MFRPSLTALLLAAVSLAAPNCTLDAQETEKADAAKTEKAMPAQGQDKELSMIEKASLILAYRQFSMMKKQGAELDLEQIIAGARLALSDAELGMTDEEVVTVLNAYQEEMVRRLMERRKATGEVNKAEAEKFFAANKAKEGVIALESGVQYKVLKVGEGATPEITDSVEVRYTGKLLNGTVFDTSGDGPPVRFPVGGVIRGMTEILQKMKVGEKVEVYIPSELAYGEEGPKDRMGRPVMDSEIGPNAALMFELEIIQIVK